MHAVGKEDSSTTKVRVVFDASAKSASCTSLNDLLLVGPTIHPSLVAVLVRFRFHQVALTADVSKMYRGVELVLSDRDSHRFFWRTDKEQPLKDYRMTRLTFGLSASSFAVNMALKQNAMVHATQYPQAAQIIDVDDCLTGADSEENKQLQNLFCIAGFILRKWNSSEPNVIKNLPSDLMATQPLKPIPEQDGCTKTV